MSGAANREYVTLTVSSDTRRRVKYIGAATGKDLNEVTAEAVKLLQDRYQLPDPPIRKAE
jgi:hypothetical protein